MATAQEEDVQTQLGLLREALERGKHKRLRRMLRTMHPAKVASLLETLTPSERAAVWQQVDDAQEDKVLSHLSPAMREEISRDAGLGEDETETEAALGTGAGDDESRPAVETQLTLLLDALERGKLRRVGRLFNRLHPARIAGLLESVPAADRATAWEMVDQERAGKVLRHLHEEVRRRLAAEMECMIFFPVSMLAIIGKSNVSDTFSACA